MVFYRKVSGCMTLAAGLMAGVSAMPAYAQAQAAVKAEAAKDSDIIVTAQRREQALQDVPIAISAIGAEEISDRGIADVRALAGSVPSLSISGPTGITGGQLLSIRGVSNQASAIGVPQTVAVYIDGEYQPGPFSAFFSLDDVQRIEVLRGPQGTLYGRNASGGAINIITRMPGDTLKGGIDVSYGNYKHALIKGSVSGPIASGFGLGISGSYEKRDGFVRNTVTGNLVGGLDTYTLRGKISYHSPDGRFNALLSVDTSRKNGNDTVLRNIYTGSPVAGTLVGIGEPYAYKSLAIAEARALGSRKSTGGALTINFKVNPNLTITSLTAVRDEKTTLAYDLTAQSTAGTLGAAATISSAQKKDKSFSQELRAQYHSDAIDLTVGANYYRNKESYGFGGMPATLTLPLVSPIDNSTVKAWAIFGQAEYHIDDKLTLTAGLRWNTEDRDWTVDYRGALSAASGAATPGLLTSGKIHDSVVIPSGGIDYKITPDVMIYAKVSKGYQAPGFNATPGGTTVPSQFAAEKLTAYEAGIKSQFADRRITLNLAGFHYDYTNLQVRNVVAPQQTAVSNAGKAKIDGFEVSASVRPTKGLSISGNLSWIDAKYIEYCEQVSLAALPLGDAACTTPLFTYTTSAGTTTTGGAAGYNRAGNRLINAPKWQWNLALDYETPVGGAGDLRAHIGYSYSGIAYYNSMNDPLTGSVTPAKRLDARLGFKLHSGPEIYVYGKNLTKDYNQDFAARGGPTSAPVHISDPQTYGIGLQYRF